MEFFSFHFFLSVRTSEFHARGSYINPYPFQKHTGHVQFRKRTGVKIERDCSIFSFRKASPPLRFSSLPTRRKIFPSLRPGPFRSFPSQQLPPSLNWVKARRRRWGALPCLTLLQAVMGRAKSALAVVIRMWRSAWSNYVTAQGIGSCSSPADIQLHCPGFATQARFFSPAS